MSFLNSLASEYTTPSDWTSSSSYNVGDQVGPPGPGQTGFLYRALVAGVSDAVSPAMRATGWPAPATQPTWEAYTVHAVGDQVVPLAFPNGFSYTASTVGMTGPAQATWPLTIGGTVSDGLPSWAPLQSHATGDRIVPTTAVSGGLFYQCIEPGTTGATEPLPWPSSPGQAVSDGTVVWMLARAVPRPRDLGVHGQDPRRDGRHRRLDLPGDPRPNGGTLCRQVATWSAGASFAVGSYVRATAAKDTTVTFRCTVAGTTGSSEPSWPASRPPNVNAGSPAGTLVSDGSVTWVCVDQTVIRGGRQWPIP